MNRSSDNRRILKLKRFFTAIFFYEFLVRLWVESYFEIVLSAVLNYKKLEWSPEGELIASISAIGSGFFLVASIPVLFYILKEKQNLKIIEKARTLIEDLRLKKEGQRLYFFFFLLRRLLVGAVITVTPEATLP